MKAILAMFAVVSLLGTTACGARQVDVQTGDAPQAQTSLTLTNNSTELVNVYVVTGGSDLFVGQVEANSTKTLAVQGVADGSVVSLRARPVGGGDGWRRDNVTLSGSTTWRVP